MIERRAAIQIRAAIGAAVVPGEEDLITPPSEAREIAAGIGATARLVTLPGCGHLATLEQPEAVTRALLAWLG